MATADRIPAPIGVGRAALWVDARPWVWVCRVGQSRAAHGEQVRQGCQETQEEALTAGLLHLGECVAYAAALDRLLADVMALTVDAARLVLDDDTAADEIPVEPCDHCTDCGCLVVAGVHRG